MRQMPISFAKATGATSIEHNNREFDEKGWQNSFHQHIDRDRVGENVIIKQEPIRDAYERIFGEALQKYNDKQRRKDRKISNYYEHVKQSKTLHTQYEFVVQVGKKEDFENSPENWQTANDILLEYVEEFQERNPNFEIYNAVIHNDETSPHLHLNVIPVATGYKRGLERQPAFNKALEQQGVEMDANPRTIFRNFRDQEVDSIELSLKKRGLGREIVGTNNIKNHHEYKEMKREVEKMTVERDEAHRKVNTLLDRKNAVERKNEALERELELNQKKISENQEILSKQKDSFEKYKKWEQDFSVSSAVGKTMQEVKGYKAFQPKKNKLGVKVAEEEPSLVSIKRTDYEEYDNQLTQAHQARLIAERRVEEEREAKEKALKERDKWQKERNNIAKSYNHWVERSDEFEAENDTLKRENAVLREKVSRVKSFFDQAHHFIDERLPDVGNNQYKDNLHGFLDKSETWIDERIDPFRDELTYQTDDELEL